jgi:tripartite-type tricarboxylate transporter receptor subunit TctC
MKFPRRRFLQLAAGAVALPAVSRTVRAQTAYPTRPVRCIVGYAPGGGTDIFVRLVGQLLPARLGQPFVIENRPGASSNLATETVIRGPADGYTLLGVDAAAAINATLYDNLSFNFVRDIAVVGMSRGPLVVAVHPSVPAKTLLEFIAYAKGNPGKIAMASAGSGSTNHLAGELFKAMTGVDMTHVPYRGGGAIWVAQCSRDHRPILYKFSSTILRSGATPAMLRTQYRSDRVSLRLHAKHWSNNGCAVRECAGPQRARKSS